MASIRGEHSVESDKSHYFAEVAAVQAFGENPNIDGFFDYRLRPGPRDGAQRDPRAGP